ncbi:hypothetical protein BDV95DRAFT_585829 [Massariosphaeria phaeospora]|uniref:F-box domain-containing protein n=1 Tax=Massariosphaeria phaeospora TaxID=100035 RepID=A0A7C8I1S3_9PLEO|nr:hypothetical protein BDV95DRAFT_585829 [Massariosphaeria phaeospora]
MDSVVSLLSRVPTFRNIAYTLDKHNGTYTMEDFYKRHLFQSPAFPQTSSLLMNLPPEIRLMIYDWVATTPYSPNHPPVFPLLATCRLIHGEAIATALQRTQFHLQGAQGLNFRPALWSLGALQQHLRHVEITVPLARLDAVGANNPFALALLPLNELVIDFGDLDLNLGARDWKTDVALCSRLVSALLNRSEPAALGDATALISSSAARGERLFQIDTWQFAPRREQLYDVLMRIRAKKVLVRAEDHGADFLWSAFTLFKLVDHHLTMVRVSSVDRAADHKVRYLLFADVGEQTTFEIGRVEDESRKKKTA